MSTCDTCLRDDLQQFHKCCRRCGSRNTFYVKSVKVAEPTELEIKIAQRLFAEGIDFVMGPEIWYSSCTYYTPDFLIENRFVVEIDGQHHYTNPHQVLMDRIRQRAIENSGYPVYRFTNQEVRKSLDKIILKILSLINATKVTKSSSKIIEIDIPKEQRSSLPIYILKKCAHELYSRTNQNGWTSNVFEDVFSEFPFITSNRCAMQQTMMLLLGLNFKASDDGTADFQNYARLFDHTLLVFQEFFGEIGKIELKNEFNISATNFLKNLIIYGKPRILRKRIITIQNDEDIQNLLENFNSNFSKFGIQVSEEDLKIECLHEKEKISRRKSKNK